MRCFLDNIIRFSDIHIIESLEEQGWALRTGAHLLEDLEPRARASTPPVNVEYHRLTTPQELWTRLDVIESDVRRLNRSPLLHIEVHGSERDKGNRSTSAGIVLASGDLIEWTQLIPKFTAINENLPHIRCTAGIV